LSYSERPALDGRVDIVLREPDGAVHDRRLAPNLITTAGRTLLAGLLSGTAQVQPTDISIGIGTADTPPTPDDTALGQQVDAAPARIDNPQVKTIDGSQAVAATVRVTFPPLTDGTAQEIREAGILIARPGAPPVLYNRAVFAVISRSAALELTLSWEVLF
jgi:hypothetical protein